MTTTPILAFDYTVGVRSFSVLLLLSFGINNEFDDDLACTYNFLGFSLDFSPIF